MSQNSLVCILMYNPYDLPKGVGDQDLDKFLRESAMHWEFVNKRSLLGISDISTIRDRYCLAFIHAATMLKTYKHFTTSSYVLSTHRIS